MEVTKDVDNVDDIHSADNHSSDQVCRPNFDDCVYKRMTSIVSFLVYFFRFSYLESLASLCIIGNDVYLVAQKYRLQRTKTTSASKWAKATRLQTNVCKTRKSIERLKLGRQSSNITKQELE